MAVIYYQLFIVISLLVVRAVFPARLLLAALIWTGLTIINLFYPPLVIIQLVVVWTVFVVLNPRRVAAEPAVTPARVSGSGLVDGSGVGALGQCSDMSPKAAPISSAWPRTCTVSRRGRRRASSSCRASCAASVLSAMPARMA